MVLIVPRLALPLAAIDAGVLCGLGLLVLVVLAVGLYFWLRSQQGTPSTWDQPPPRIEDSPAPTLASGAVATPRPRPAVAPPRAAQDGFWYRDPAVTPGTTLRYRCRVGGSIRNGSFIYQPGPEGHFIYTGGLPTEVEISHDLATGTGTRPSPGTSTGTRSTSGTGTSRDDSDTHAWGSSFDRDEDEEDLPARVAAGLQEDSGSSGAGASFDSPEEESSGAGGTFDSSEEESSGAGGSFDSESSSSGAGASFSEPPAY